MVGIGGSLAEDGGREFVRWRHAVGIGRLMLASAGLLGAGAGRPVLAGAERPRWAVIVLPRLTSVEGEGSVRFHGGEKMPAHLGGFLFVAVDVARHRGEETADHECEQDLSPPIVLERERFP